ncbi:Nn.00g017830.m01.CDS01 [Neocucurbitaria sp. VM-36]
MAPTPTGENLAGDPTSSAKPDPGYWTKANIAVTTVFALLALGIFLALLLFFLHRRSQKKKHATPHADKAGLLANEDKTSMFSRNRESSVTLYVDSEVDAQSKRASQETTSLIPLQITPVEESRDPMNIHQESTGSGVSAMSRSTNTNTLSTILLSPISPIGEEGDLGIRPTGRPRSTSSASQRARYYETTPQNIAMPPIPKIIRTPSDDETR